MRRQSAWFALVAALMSASVAFAAVEDYPNRPITIVMGISKGGITDVITRAYAEIVSKDLGQPVIIENRPTESATAAAVDVQHTPPDGYTLLAFSGAQHTAMPSIETVAYDPVKGFGPVTTLFTLVNFLAVPAGSDAASVADLIRLGQSKPGGLRFGSSGIGSTSHLTAAQMALTTRTAITPVHYAGAAAMIADLVAGKLDFAFVSYTVAKPFVAQGKLKLLAVDAARRWPDLPGLPTLRQAGIDQAKIASWFALAAPAGTPEPIIAKLHDTFARASRDPALVSAMRDNGAIATIITPEELRVMMANEVDRAAALAANLKLRQ
jgi:tripartite-type tricarboxylate transporter receptor subunit TctC